MSLKRLVLAVLLATTGAASQSWAQFAPGGLGAAGAAPTTPAGIGAAAAGALGGSQPIVIQQAAPAAGPQRTIWGFFGISKANCAACKANLCNSQLGQMMNSGLAPISGLTGGLIPQFCPSVPTAADIANLTQSGASPAVIQAAKIKAEEADAKARVAAVEYLGTVDCNYWPEAQVALLKSLRADRNECVRYAAARVLSNGCCCGKETIRSLTITVMGTGAIGPKGKTEDGNPAETSERVRCAAMIALQTCVAIVPPEPVEIVPPPDRNEGPIFKPAPKPDGEGPQLRPTTSSIEKTDDGNLARTAFLKILAKKPMGVVVRDARIALEIVGKQEPMLFTTGNRSLMNAIARARTTPKAAAIANANANATGAVNVLNAPAPGLAPDAPATPPPSVEMIQGSGTNAPTLTPESIEPNDLPPLPPTSTPDTPPTVVPALPSSNAPIRPDATAAPVPASVRPVLAPAPTDAGVQLRRSAPEQPPAFRPVRLAASPMPVAATSGLMPTSYQTGAGASTSARSTPPTRPRLAQRTAASSAPPAEEPDAALYERFRRDPDSFRGDYPR